MNIPTTDELSRQLKTLSTAAELEKYTQELMDRCPVPSFPDRKSVV